MGLFSKFVSKVGNIANQDVMEAVVAGCVLVAACDGDFSDTELTKVEKLLRTNKSLSSFDPSVIRKTLEKYREAMEDFRTGQAQLLKEISDVATNPEQSEMVFLSVLSVAESDGEISSAEMKVIKQLCSELGLNLRNYDLAA